MISSTVSYTINYNRPHSVSTDSVVGPGPKAQNTAPLENSLVTPAVHEHTHTRPHTDTYTHNYSQLKYCIQNSWNSSNVHHHNMITNDHRTWRHKYLETINGFKIPTTLLTVCKAEQCSEGYMGVTLLLRHHLCKCKNCSNNN